MGSYSNLYIKNMLLHSYKNHLAIGSSLFSYEDKIKRAISGYSNGYENYVLCRKVSSVIPRLQLMGYTVKNAKKILRNLFLKDVKVPVPILDIPKDIRLSVQKLTNILNDIRLGVKEEFIYFRRDI